MAGTSKKVAIGDATHNDLFVFVTTELGITEIKPEATLLELRAKANAAGFTDKHKINAVAVVEPVEAGSSKTVTVPVERDTVSASPSAPESDEDYDEQFMVITIARSEKPGGDRPVYAGCNGKGIWLPRGEPIKVRRKFVNVLEDAKEEIYDEVLDGTGLGAPRAVHVYPFSIMHQHVAA